ncbi:MAG: C45 family peptidase [Planctomycetaceae bacterium]
MRLQYAILFCVSVLFASSTQGEVIARSGKGWLEEQHGQLVLHLKGSHYEMGRQHGELLRDHVQQNLNHLVNVKGDTTLVDVGPLKLKPRAAIELIVTIQRDFVPEWYFEELRGLADGAELPEKDVQVANFIPELFHCSGFAIMNSATKDGTLYHGRVLDYAIDWGLQDHAVVIVSEPDGEIPFVNVSYAGFIGCVTGMNANHISIGEMGGAGLGHWHGMPMAVLMREALQTCSTLDEVLDLYRGTPRTCQYFYVVADGNTNRAVGMEASWDRMDVIHTGEKHERLPIPVTDCALLSAGSRYEELVTRVKAGHGTFTAEDALHLMDRPVAMKSNLHNVLFEPASTRFWVSNAGSDGTPAAERPYTAFDLRQLLAK